MNKIGNEVWYIDIVYVEDIAIDCPFCNAEGCVECDHKGEVTEAIYKWLPIRSVVGNEYHLLGVKFFETEEEAIAVCAERNRSKEKK